MKLAEVVRCQLTVVSRPKWSIHYAPKEAARLIEPKPLGVVRAYTPAEAIRTAEITLTRRFPDAALSAVPAFGSKRSTLNSRPSTFPEVA